MILPNIPNKVKVGDEVKAADHNRLLDLVAQLVKQTNAHAPKPSPDVLPRISSGGTTFHTTGKNGGTSANSCAFLPRFVVTETGLDLSFAPTYVFTPNAIDGTVEPFAPELGGTPIANTTGAVPWSRPVHAISSANDYDVYLVTEADWGELIVQTAATDPPTKEKFNQVSKVCEFTVGTVSGNLKVISRRVLTCEHVTIESTSKPACYPIVYNTGTPEAPSWKAKITTCLATDLPGGTVTEVSNPLAALDIETGDKIYLKLSISTAGAVSGLIYEVASSPTNTEWEDGSTGTYYFEVAEIATADNGGLYATQKRNYGIDWMIPAESFSHPFHATLNGSSISLLGGAYQVGATGAWVTVPATAASAGSFAYLVIVQDYTRAVTSVYISVEASPLAAVVIAGDPEVATSNVLLAEVVGGEIIQRRHGNFTLGLWQIDGDVARWTETLVGGIPAT